MLNDPPVRESEPVERAQPPSFLVRVARLRLREWMVLGQMVGLLSAFLVLQRFLPLPRLMELFDARATSSAPSVSPRRLAQLCDALLRRLYHRDYCLKRSVLLFRALRKRGNPVRIFFGVRKEEEALAGHAWVEIDGVPFVERGDPRKAYNVTYSYPPLLSNEVSTG